MVQCRPTTPCTGPPQAELAVPDYVGRCASFPGLSDAINHCQYLTPVLTASELREAIVRPAEDYGTHVSDDLVAEILADMHAGTAYDSDNLPL